MRSLLSNYPGISAGNAKFHRIAWIARASALVVGLTGVTACGGEDPAQAGAAEQDDDIFGGVKDDDSTSKSAVVALRIKRANNYELCSGALIAPNVVLTARHCVARILTDTVSCTDCGRTWNSATMAEGLRLLGSCPRCRGELSFSDADPAASAEAPKVSRTVAPHMVLGIPRPDGF